jgi:predicted dehydrogenase
MRPWTEWKGYRFFVEALAIAGWFEILCPNVRLLITQDSRVAPGGRFASCTRDLVREKLKSWTSTALLSFEEELADFLRMINGETVPLADGFAGFRAVEIANAVYQSTVESRAIALSPKP